MHGRYKPSAILDCAIELSLVWHGRKVPGGNKISTRIGENVDGHTGLPTARWVRVLHVDSMAIYTKSHVILGTRKEHVPGGVEN